ncbi:hypothetical protein CC80DRAFT_594446 [Byssothecium circinans]|uniref:Transmembrane 9 superfamily member n=1 Tax=Byssothecium circinans TaxID=147558 RepID=A0A6A5U265_9PLEO|nr:hypothetical protein CC80DRAFT_594446 [Byssothecium circinans]
MRGNAIIALLVSTAQGLHIPGFTPRTYRTGSPLPVLLSTAPQAPSNSTSPSTQTYAYADLPIACPQDPYTYPYTRHTSIPLSLVQILHGTRITTSPALLTFGRDEKNKLLCRRALKLHDLETVKDLIAQGYRVEWRIDGVPGAQAWKGVVEGEGEGKYFERGVRVGRKVFGGGGEGKGRGMEGLPRYEIFNHFDILVRWGWRVSEMKPLRRGPRGMMEKGGRVGVGVDKVVVGVEVFPKSVGLKKKNANANSDGKRAPLTIFPVPERFEEKRSLTVPFTYSVYWREDEMSEWRDRWGKFAGEDEGAERELWRRVGVLGGVVVALVGVGSILVWVFRGGEGEHGKREGVIRLSANLRSQLASLEKENGSKKKGKKSYGLLVQVNDMDATSSLSSSSSSPTSPTPSTSSDSDEDKDPHPQTALFHPQAHMSTLPPLLSAGIQTLSTTTLTTLLYALHTSHPRFSTFYLIITLTLWCTAALYSGYTSSRLYKTYHGQQWRRNALLTTVLLPSLVSAFLHVVNVSVWWQTCGAPFISLGKLLVLGVTWVVAQGGFVYLGAWWGYAHVGGYIVAMPRTRREVGTRLVSYGYGRAKGVGWGKRRGAGLLGAGGVVFAVVFGAGRYVLGHSNVDVESSGVGGVLAIAAVGLLAVVVVVGIVLLSVWWGVGEENQNIEWALSSFILGAASAPFVFAYLVYSFLTSPLSAPGLVSTGLYAGYTGLVFVAWGIAGGAVGVLAASWMVLECGGGGDSGGRGAGKKE